MIMAEYNPDLINLVACEPPTFTLSLQSMDREKTFLLDEVKLSENESAHVMGYVLTKRNFHESGN